MQKDFVGPYSLEDLIKNDIHKSWQDIKEDGGAIVPSGIYMWGVKVDSNYFPIYVGKSRNIPERIFQHVIRFFGGEYFIPNWDSLINPDRNYFELRKNIILIPYSLPKELLYFPT